MILARALFGEARSALNAAKTAVAWVIRNRVEHPRHRWGKTYHDVILQKEHFSAFNQSDPNRPFVENPFHTENEIDKKAWLSCYEVANLVIKGEDPDPTGGANHYYSDSRYGPPFWATKATFKVKIGPFYFHEL
ncbi:MAG: hypothetical protein A3H72_00850 [Candidatus Doudnabacteria bacterium RIFCSPLOWO2_02_FULL_48_8]|uniref:Cell wall hydrolase SleB domain-containing protein n=1 Tax=Candidatus Doudnabacteria bacterium RIFCSPHIGHO2_01_FULL_46_24 TaxID=1817825 RepID=A0A1F5NTS0_9BACT|nr:MAG: hypothetical protein A2720_03935 [Candidatus Doudnabacteria bacterium RIFCSPHIGHO2_01_FULL_46_24]OGE95242.1 MAG: hypothetical protein A3H72_00850 [Candidatus Doudnabacteria bacterium RIFCSPLOWO2_02_FULL_48_8]OGE95901.1 MAG: hypothetical protein A3E98_03945 [Candidatus Doudnabacteria bacterium RIFCSPHIGHO2_12_FULL_48_11]